MHRVAIETSVNDECEESMTEDIIPTSATNLISTTKLIKEEIETVLGFDLTVIPRHSHTDPQ